MERTIKLVVAYDGTDFHGWQRQDGVRTVQAELEAVLRRVLRHPLSVAGSSRTDAGVHARGQVAVVRTTATIPTPNLARAVGHHVPPDMAIVSAREVAEGFHPSRDAVGKHYCYRIYNAVARPVIDLVQRYAWHVWYPLDVARMQQAAAAMVGTHDFTSFATQGSPRATMVRTVWRVDIRQRGAEVQIDVRGDGFLYNQIRIMVGVLYEVGRGHWEPERVPAIIAARDRRQASLTAPPHGLRLERVYYDPAEIDDGTA
jgi:tRNA pseudouridine38-40 synthase